MDETTSQIIEDARKKIERLNDIIGESKNEIEKATESLEYAERKKAEWVSIIEKLGGTPDAKAATKHRVQWFNTDNLTGKYAAPVVVHGEGCNHIKVSQRDPYMKAGLETVSDVEEWESSEDFAGDYNADFHAEGGNEACWPIAFFPCTGMVERLTITTGYDKD